MNVSDRDKAIVDLANVHNFRGITGITGLVIHMAGLEITAGQRTMSGLTVDLTGQTFVLPVMLTGQNSVVLKMK